MQCMKIDVKRNDDIRYWAERFGVSRTHLIAAVAAAGPKVTDVEAWIRTSRRHNGEAARHQARRKLAFHSFD